MWQLCFPFNLGFSTKLETVCLLCNFRATQILKRDMGNKISQDEEVTEEKKHSSFQDIVKSKFHSQESGSRKNSLKFNSSETGNSILYKNESNTIPEDEPGSQHSTPSKTLSRKHPECLSKLAKVLVTLSQGEENSNGISLSVFTKFVCQSHASLGTHLYEYFLKNGRTPNKKQKTVLCKEAFISCAHKVMDLVGDNSVRDYYVSVFADPDETVTQASFCDFLKSCYLLSCGEGTDSVNEDVIASVITAVFRNKQAVSTKYVVHWLESNCPRILTWLHRYVVHRFTVGHRLINNTASDDASMASPLNLDTPILDSSPTSTDISKRFTFESVKNPQAETRSSDLKLDPMQVWLLAASLPVSFTKQPLQKSPSTAGFVLMDPRTFINQMIAAQTPTHWVPLYDSDMHGLSQNRFLHHVMGYRASSILLLRGEGNYLFCVAVDQEWKDSNHFWGGGDCTAIQISPEYHILDKGEKLMYYNTSIRGYPYGLQVSTDHKSPVLEVDKDMARISYRKIPIRLENIEVWGCGSQQQREAQTEYKRWELKQVEKSREMKLKVADWNEHPDKYLLDLAGNRPNYSEYNPN